MKSLFARKLLKKGCIRALISLRSIEQLKQELLYLFMGKRIFHVLLIIVVGLLVYSNTFNVPFQWDDTPNIVENYKLKDLNNFWPPSESRWLGFLTFALNYHFGGLNTIGYHAVNLIMHIFNAILVYWLVVLTFKTPFFSNQQSEETNFGSPIHPFSSASGGQAYLPLFIALIFVAHPIQTQAVTYIVQRFTSLATFFYLLSIVMYIKWREGKGQRAEGEKQQAMSNDQLAKRYASYAMLYAISIISAILAMKTKEIAFTLPFIITLYEFMFFGNNKFVIPVKTGIQDKNEMDSCFRRNDKMDDGGYKRLLYLIPFLLTLLIIPLSVIGTDKPIGDAIGELREAAQETAEIPRWSYLLTQFRVIVTYIRLLVLPINQNLDYDYPIYHSFFNPEVVLSLLFLLLIFALGIYLLYAKRFTLYASRFLSFGILWFFITLSIESSIIPIRDVIFEHRLYLPSVGVFIAITTPVFILASKLKKKWPQIEKTVTPVLALIIIIFSSATYARNIVWQDEVSLWEDVVKKSPEKARGHYNLGNAYYYQGRLDEAIQAYHIALRLKPDYVEAHNNIGLVYYYQGRLDEAIQAYHIALKIEPDYAEAYNNLGIAYGSKGLIDKALECYQIALKFKPDFVKAHFNLGFFYLVKRDIENAHKEFEVVLQIDPGNPEAQRFLNYLSKPKQKDSTRRQSPPVE